MKKCPWEEIHGFESPEEFEQFEKWIAEQIELGVAEQININVQSIGSCIITKERWYKHLDSGEVWRLEDPDPPFYGTFEPVKIQ